MVWMRSEDLSYRRPLVGSNPEWVNEMVEIEMLEEFTYHRLDDLAIGERKAVSQDRSMV